MKLNTTTLSSNGTKQNQKITITNSNSTNNMYRSIGLDYLYYLLEIVVGYATNLSRGLQKHITEIVTLIETYGTHRSSGWIHAVKHVV